MCLLLLGLSVASCGRVSLELLPLDDTRDLTDSGGMGAGGADDGAAQPARDAEAESGVVEPAADAAREDAEAGVDVGACSGASVFGLCWYLGSETESCNQACAPHGGFDMRAIAYVGSRSQGGSVNECADVMRGLGLNGSVNEGVRNDEYGFGCHVWTPDGALWWLVSPDFDPSQAAPRPSARSACGCLR